MFIVPTDTPGVDILRDVATMEHPWEDFGKLGGHAEIEYRDVRVPADSRLGAEGEGFLIAQQRLYPGRIHHCMRWLGQARRAFDMLCERATYRFSHGKVLGEHQTVQNWIADSAAQMQAARLMTLHAAWVMDTQGVSAARQPISLIKFFGAEVLHDVVDRAIQAHGSLGYSTDLPLEGMYRFARAARIYDGPDEVHRQSVARQILRGYEPPADEVPSEHVPSRHAAARRKFAELLETVTAND
jgi:acyl-CoA dehydrogenase